MQYKPSPELLLHYGIPRKSGRYPWGSGEDPRQRDAAFNFLKDYDALKSKGIPQTEIASKLGMNTRQLRDNITWANAERDSYNRTAARSLKDTGLSNVAIGEKLGVSEATIRNYLSDKTPAERTKKLQLDNINEAIKSGVDRTGYLDVGVGVERQLGVSREKFNAVVNKLAEEEGYYIHQVFVKRLSDNTRTDPAKGEFAKYTTVKVLTKDPDVKSASRNKDKIRPLDTWSEDGAESLVKLKPPEALKLDRIKVRYKEEGGADKDGTIELRPGVKDLDLGNKRYAQVRIAAEGDLYLKGMAIYGDPKDFPKGVDVIYNRPESRSVPKEQVLKKMQMTSEQTDDPSFMFGTSIRRQKGALNVVYEQGEWDTWAGTISSQFLSKQPTSLIKERLDDTYSKIRKEYDEINSMTNPIVKQFLMDKFVEGLPAKAKHLKAKGLAGTKSHVLLPFPDMNPDEVYATNYKNGDRVALVRHPHGGKFEIPDLVVNNKHATAKKLLGVVPDAIGIHPSVAEKLSGADFDGDTALVIPNNHGKVKSDRSLKELKNFDPKMYKRDHETISNRAMQTQMGMISNLITDMTIKGASQSELARAVRHSMVVIDSHKHKLDYKQSERDHQIPLLVRDYQTHKNPDTGKTSRGASTLISRSKRKVDITDPNFDPHKYSSRTAQEDLYANYINNLKSTMNEAKKMSQSITPPKYSKEAAKIYAPELQSLNAKLNVALLNAPKARQVQILTNKLYRSNLLPDMDKDQIKKLKARALAKATVTVGAKKSNIEVEPREWEAIQAGAVSKTKLLQILNNANIDTIRKLAAPREAKLTTVKAERARSLLSKGYTYAEVAERMGVSTTLLREELSRNG